MKIVEDFSLPNLVGSQIVQDMEILPEPKSTIVDHEIKKHLEEINDLDHYQSFKDKKHLQITNQKYPQPHRRSETMREQDSGNTRVDYENPVLMIGNHDVWHAERKY